MSRIAKRGTNDTNENSLGERERRDERSKTKDKTRNLTTKTRRIKTRRRFAKALDIVE
jgi:hypothetical protein